VQELDWQFSGTAFHLEIVAWGRKHFGCAGYDESSQADGFYH
jgi:hypothetical protein